MAEILKYPGQGMVPANSTSNHPRIGLINQGVESASAHLVRFTSKSIILEVNLDLCLFSETHLVLSKTLTNGHDVRPLPVAVTSSSMSDGSTVVEFALTPTLLADVRRVFELAGYTTVMASETSDPKDRVNFG